MHTAGLPVHEKLPLFGILLLVVIEVLQYVSISRLLEGQHQNELVYMHDKTI